MTIPCQRISESEWDAIPTKSRAKAASVWEPILDDLEAGEPVSIEVESAEQAKGYSIGLSRRAGARQMKLEFRFHEGRLAVRKSAEGQKPKASSSQRNKAPARRSRRAQGTSDPEE